MFIVEMLVLVNPIFHFNTSNVNVHLHHHYIAHKPKDDFNTSNVNVHHKSTAPRSPQLLISIHLMLMFIRSWMQSENKKINFNTSNVNVHL